MKYVLVVIPLLAAIVAGSARTTEVDVGLVERSGTVSGWRVNVDGTVFLRLREASETETWFRNPPDRSSVISFEEMLLAIVVDVAGTDEVITVAAERSGLDGSSPESAIPLAYVSWP